MRRAGIVVGAGAMLVLAHCSRFSGSTTDPPGDAGPASPNDAAVVFPCDSAALYCDDFEKGLDTKWDVQSQGGAGFGLDPTTSDDGTTSFESKLAGKQTQYQASRLGRSFPSRAGLEWSGRVLLDEIHPGENIALVEINFDAADGGHGTFSVYLQPAGTLVIYTDTPEDGTKYSSGPPLPAPLNQWFDLVVAVDFAKDTGSIRVGEPSSVLTLDGSGISFHQPEIAKQTVLMGLESKTTDPAVTAWFDEARLESR